MDKLENVFPMLAFIASNVLGGGIFVFVLLLAVPIQFRVRTVAAPQRKKPPTIWPDQPFEIGHIVEVTRDNSRNQHRGRPVPAGVFGKVTRVATHTVRVEFYDHSFSKSQRSCWMDVKALTLVPRLP